jgi:hypothetical protein
MIAYDLPSWQLLHGIQMTTAIIGKGLGRLLAALAFTLGTVGAVSAAPISNPNTCSTDSFTIDSIVVSPLNGGQVVYSGPGIEATSCFGKVTAAHGIGGGNDHWQGLSAPTNNRGELGDGLLNGERGFISPTQFIDSSQLLDLDGDGIATDPGWLFLGSVDRDAGTKDLYNKPLDLSTVLDIGFTCDAGSDCTSGTWVFETDPDIIEVVQAILGRNAFDHLAFVIKAGPAFAIYDFDFDLIAPNLIGDGVPYSFRGSWNTLDFMNPSGKNPQAFSHISVWARDPLETSSVPAPATALVLGLGLLSMQLVRRARTQRLREA